jgi:hypothetical protein
VEDMEYLVAFTSEYHNILYFPLDFTSRKRIMGATNQEAST